MAKDNAGVAAEMYNVAVHLRPNHWVVASDEGVVVAAIRVDVREGERVAALLKGILEGYARAKEN